MGIFDQLSDYYILVELVKLITQNRIIYDSLHHNISNIV